MFQRTLKPLKSKSFFLFGARGTGKSYLLKQIFADDRHAYIDLLDVKQADELIAYPERFQSLLDASLGKCEWIVVDEVQKTPKLLDYVHQYIASKKFLFALTGSSARKLKRGASNLLAGRAHVFQLFPLTHREIGADFDLDTVLSFGALPDAVTALSDRERKLFLDSYSQTYLKEEIISEQIVRNLPPFIRFLDAAAQANGEILSYSSIAKDIGSDPKTVSNYYDILEDTLVGIRLPSFHRSIRKQQKKSSKFYFFDTGVVRAILGQTDYKLTPKSFEYGRMFESFITNECYRLLKYSEKNFKISFLRISDNQEIDLIIERNNQPTILCEIKSSDSVHEGHCHALATLSPNFRNSVKVLVSRDYTPKKFGVVECLHWREFFKNYF